MPKKSVARRKGRIGTSNLNLIIASRVVLVLLLAAAFLRSASQAISLNVFSFEQAATTGRLLLSTRIFSPKAQQRKYAIYMTTHLNQEHIEFLTNCWPAAIEKLPLLQQADFVVYTSSNNTDDNNNLLQRTLGGGNNQVHIYRYQQDKANDYGDNWRLKKQDGAVTAMVDPFLPQNQHWFDGYEWIIRLNPDVLIRRDLWLLQTMQDKSVDAIFVDWRKNFKKKFPKAMHTDFFAFRPKATNGTALLEMYQHQKQIGKIHAESHVYSGFEHVIENGRMAFLPNVTGNFRYARTAGPDCDVVHHHPLLQACPNYFDAPI